MPSFHLQMQDTTQILCALMIALAGGLLQGTVAFGFGLLSVPLLMMVGLPLPAVLAISAVCTVVQSASGVHHLRHVVPWREVGMSVAVRAVTLVLGVLVLREMVNFPMMRLKFWIGLIMLAMVLLQGLWQPRPRPRLHVGWNLAAFSASGFIGGLCSMGGPPMVLWVMAHDWTSERTRAFLFGTFMSVAPFQLAVLYLTFGDDVVKGMALGAALSPVVLLGSLLGLRIGARFSKPLLRRLAFLLLIAIALNAMYPQVWRWVTS
jgi:uncharacterized protein